MNLREVKSIGIGAVCYNSATLEDSPILQPRKEIKHLRFGYAMMGTGALRYPDLGVTLPYKEGDFFDLHDYKNSTEADIEITSDVAMCVVFSVVDPSENLEATLLKEGSYNLTKGDTAEIIFVIKGEVSANEVIIPAKKFAYLPENKTVQVIVPEGSVAVHFKKQ